MSDIEKIKELIPCFVPMEEKVNEIPMEKQINMFRTMCLIRTFEERVRDLWLQNKIKGLAHLYVYAEAIASGACEALEPGDYITSTHRGHGHALARGADPRRMMAELLGKQEGYNRGKGGSMHIADVSAGILGANGIVGSGIGPATGAALSSKIKKDGKVSLCFFGDGASNQGPLFECMNMAATWNLPVIYLCENNFWGIGTELNRITKNDNLSERGIGLRVPGEQVDGFNVLEVYRAVKKAVDKARAGEGPTLIEARFMRIEGHHSGDTQAYRDLSSIKFLYDFDPILRLQKYLTDVCDIKTATIDAIRSEINELIDEAVSYAENECTEPSPDALYEDLYANGEIIL